MKHSRYIFPEPISRAEALRRMAAAVTVGALGLSGCNPTPSATPVTVGAAEGKVSRRRNPRNGDEVSMLGFGCMRFPTVGGDRYTGDIDRAPTRQMLEYAYECKLLRYGVDVPQRHFGADGGRGVEAISPRIILSCGQDATYG